MLSPAEQLVLAALERALTARFGERLVDLRLFGSRARGTGRDDSDLDVAIDLVDPSRADRRDVLDLAADLGIEHGLVLSPLVRDARRTERAPIDDVIDREGVRP